MTVHWNSRIGLAYAIAVAYVLATIAVVSMIGKVFVQQDQMPLWLVMIGAATSLAAWPLANLTNRVVGEN